MLVVTRIYSDSMLKKIQAFYLSTGGKIQIHPYGGFNIARLQDQILIEPNRDCDVAVLVGTNDIFSRRINDRYEKVAEHEYANCGKLTAKLKSLSLS